MYQTNFQSKNVNFVKDANIFLNRQPKVTFYSTSWKWILQEEAIKHIYKERQGLSYLNTGPSFLCHCLQITEDYCSV